MADTPADLGYSMPAEWAAHRGTWLAWPKDPDTFPSTILPAVERAYVSMISALSRGEDVMLLVDDAKSRAKVEGLLKRKERVHFVEMKTADVWVRDYGPIYVRGQDLAVVKWKFNAWGGKYEDLLPDDGVGESMAVRTGLRVFRPPLVLEGGSVDVDGAGTMLTTRQCLLNENRNPHLDARGVEQALRSYLGAKKVVWLGSGIEGDDTDGHVDDIARFVGPRRVAVAVEGDAGDANHSALAANLEELRRATDKDGRDFETIEVPMPRRLEAPDGRLPASHLNFYIGNAAVLVPTFGGVSDRAAIRIIGEAFPDREVVGVDCRALVHGLGTIHCVTQQIPVGP